ncbi:MULTISPECIES: SDR family oxidoreductase [Symbiopectobacterium]|uniref:SDR family oxidoreductase n=1 Tax=Symbiopectobacterium TaxID=801 RepID=UPI001A34B8E1|nr:MULTISPECIES: SDR family oxidoreductase [Symbiopectobacterium]MBG6248410.1 SDR family oxidoreductase [Candidatus Symbiopectobacterium sp. PLON1]MBT9429851.1 SDR family oxidoreductase [Candidatus Symbiopectobacterium endolongispinus]
MEEYRDILNELCRESKTWLITGCACFIGSNLLKVLLKCNQYVVGLDNFSTGSPKNIDDVKNLVNEQQWERFNFINGDIRNACDCDNALMWSANRPVEYVLHQAALGSVPRSIDDPTETNGVNITGFLNVLMALKKSKVKRLVYAASSSTYGDIQDVPKVEHSIGSPMSPYAVTKYANELYANVFHKVYGLNSIGLRYFNVFGPRQNVNGAYAAVIPKWISQVITGQGIIINGDGSTSRDFCYIDNVVQANLRAALIQSETAINHIYNIANGESTSLNALLKFIIAEISTTLKTVSPEIDMQDFRLGDALHSLADIRKAQNFLGYKPQYKVFDGLTKTISWYVNQYK